MKIGSFAHGVSAGLLVAASLYSALVTGNWAVVVLGCYAVWLQARTGKN